MRTGANNYPEPKYRQAERRRRLTPSSSGTESELGRYTPVECDELDDDEKMEQKSVPDDETDTPERQELTANGASADTTAGAASATALNGPSNAATIRARGSDERANEAHESDDDDGMDETDQCQHNSSIHG